MFRLFGLVWSGLVWLFVCSFVRLFVFFPQWRRWTLPGLVIGGDALGPALQKLLGEDSKCVAAGID